MLQVLLLAWFAPGFAVAQVSDRFFDVELRHEHVAGNVYMLQRSDGFADVGVFIGDEGVLLVDSQFEPHAEELVAEIGEISDVLIFAHDNMRIRMLEYRIRCPRGNGGSLYEQ